MPGKNQWSVSIFRPNARTGRNTSGKRATAPAFANLFTTDATLRIPDDILDEQNHVGPEAIAAYYHDNRSHTRFLTMTSNIRVTPESDTSATGTGYISSYSHAVGGSMKDEGSLTAVMEYRDTYRVTADGCKISRRDAVYRLLNVNGIIDEPGPP